jgi:hypothetical protein
MSARSSPAVSHASQAHGSLLWASSQSQDRSRSQNRKQGEATCTNSGTFSFDNFISMFRCGRRDGISFPRLLLFVLFTVVSIAAFSNGLILVNIVGLDGK